jgi:hypothetical protein
MNKLKSILVKTAASAVLAIAPLIALGGVSYANGSVDWSGQGVSNGQFDTVQCSGDTPNPGDVLWVFTATGADSATISINGGQASPMDKEGNNGAFHFVQTGFNGDFNSLTASATYIGDTNNPQLVISHGCPGEGGQGGGQMDCDNDFDNSPQSECSTPPQPQKDCDNDFDSSPASECETPGQVLGANITTPGHGAGPSQVAVVPQGSVNGGEGAASSSLSKASAIGLFSSLLSAGAGLALFNRRQG